MDARIKSGHDDKKGSDRAHKILAQPRSVPTDRLFSRVGTGASASIHDRLCPRPCPPYLGCLAPRLDEAVRAYTATRWRMGRPGTSASAARAMACASMP